MAFAVMSGVALVAVSLNYAEARGQWLSDLLLGIGTTALLFLPFYIVGRRLDRHLDQMQQATATAIKNVREESQADVSALAQRVDDLAFSVAERLNAEQDRDVEIFSEIGHNLSREGLRHALNRANDLGIVSSRHRVRVMASHAHRIYVSVAIVGDAQHGPKQWIMAGLETLAGQKLGTDIRWEPGDTPTDFMVAVGRALAKHDASENFDPKSFAKTLSETLLVGLAHEKHRPIVELCPPQWAVVSRVLGGAIVTYGDVPLVEATSVAFKQRPDLLPHLHSEPWVDAASLDKAHMVLTSLP